MGICATVKATVKRRTFWQWAAPKNGVSKKLNTSNFSHICAAQNRTYMRSCNGERIMQRCGYFRIRGGMRKCFYESMQDRLAK